jgi:Arc/MetJ-type ribon-helix-helix transcriptional regulator
MLALNCMEVSLTPDQRAFVRMAIESGRLHSERDAIEEALSLWEERERKRVELLAGMDSAEASLARGEGYPITEESLRQLAEDVKRRGRAPRIQPVLAWVMAHRVSPQEQSDWTKSGHLWRFRRVALTSQTV